MDKYIDVCVCNTLPRIIYAYEGMCIYIHIYACTYVCICAYVRITRRAPEVAACALEALTTGHP